MRLVPPQPPGRSTRKARGFEAEISQLRTLGYTLEAIRQALACAGVHVSISTVRREARRSKVTSPARVARTAAPGAPDRAPSPGPSFGVQAAAPVRTSGDRRSSKEIAEDFMSQQITNPLIRARAS